MLSLHLASPFLQHREILNKILEREQNGLSERNESQSPCGEEDLYKRDRYIVMERLRPVVSQNYFISPRNQMYLQRTSGKLEKTEVTNELGIYGVLVRSVPLAALQVYST